MGQPFKNKMFQKDIWITKEEQINQEKQEQIIDGTNRNQQNGKFLIKHILIVTLNTNSLNIPTKRDNHIG